MENGSMILYSNSCSYGVMSTGKTYSDFIAEKLNCEVVNSGLPGCCNDRIVRTSVRDLLELKSKQTDIFALISFTSLYRFEFWNNEKPAIENDGHFRSLQLSSLNKNNYNSPIDNILIEKYASSWFQLYDDEAQICNLFSKIVLLTNFLKNNNIGYLIWFGPMNYKTVDYTTPFIKTFYQDIFNNKNIINFDQFSFSHYCSVTKGHVPYDSEKYGIYGHHCELAHKDFANYLLENYIK